MDHRERVLTALAHQEPDRIPLALWGSAYGITDGLYHNLLRELGWEPLPPFRCPARQRVHVTPFEKVEIVLAELGTDAGMMGAAAWAKQRLAAAPIIPASASFATTISTPSPPSSFIRPLKREMPWLRRFMIWLASTLALEWPT